MADSGTGDWSGEFARIFTLQEARALLPRVRDYFSRFTQAQEAAARTAQELEALEQRRTRANTMELARPLRGLREELGAHAEEMREAIHAVQDLGVQIKRLEPALIDFPSLRDGHIVFLCWQEGEETITHWHEISAGFAGRQVL